MARNIEIKARVEDLDSLREKVQLIADQGPVYLEQDDTFFDCPNGRMKLRVMGDGAGELIFYQRGNHADAKECFYYSYRTHNPDALRENLSLAYGQVGRVIKHREVWLSGRTRIHLDRVKGLGNFMELEVVLREDEVTKAGVNEAACLRDKLGIAAAHLIDVAYVDLINNDANEVHDMTRVNRIES